LKPTQQAAASTNTVVLTDRLADGALQEYIATISYDVFGNVISTTYTLPDMTTPYTPVNAPQFTTSAQHVREITGSTSVITNATVAALVGATQLHSVQILIKQGSATLKSTTLPQPDRVMDTFSQMQEFKGDVRNGGNLYLPCTEFELEPLTNDTKILVSFVVIT
jgi:hypothetical protein